MGNEQSNLQVREPSTLDSTSLNSTGSQPKEKEARHGSTDSSLIPKEQLCQQYQITAEEYDTAFSIFSRKLQESGKSQKENWTLSRTRQLLFSGKPITFTLYLQLLRWWKLSSDQVKLQYIFHFLDLDGDGIVSFMDLLCAMEKLVDMEICEDDVVVVKSNGQKGKVRYIGPNHSSKKQTLWIGIELDRPLGNMNGAWKNHPYFECPIKHGLFLPKEKCILRDLCTWCQSMFYLFSTSTSSSLPNSTLESETQGEWNSSKTMTVTWDRFAEIAMNQENVVTYLHQSWTAIVFQSVV